MIEMVQSVWGVGEQLQCLQIGVSCHFKALGYMLVVFATLGTTADRLISAPLADQERYQGRGGVVQIGTNR
jgi:hypothetical protein